MKAPTWAKHAAEMGQRMHGEVLLRKAIPHLVAGGRKDLAEAVRKVSAELRLSWEGGKR